MRKGRFRKKILPALMTAAMVMSLMPATAFAVTGSQVAADGTYTASYSLSDVEGASEAMEDDEWTSYTITVSLTVADGIFSDISVTSDDISSGSETYLKKATTKSQGFVTLLKGESATAETVSSWDAVSNATITSTAVKNAALSALKSAAEATEEEEETDNCVYVLMNVPYGDFYSVIGDDGVDAVSSATCTKTRTGSLVAGSYHVNSDGTDITGIIYYVYLPESALEDLNEITDDSSFTIETTNRGTTTSTTYTGAEALFEAESYSYYKVSETPDYYLTAVAADDGVTFTGIVGDTTSYSNVEAEYTTNTTYGDYQLNISEDTLDTILEGSNVSAVTLNMTDGSTYGLRHLENIWLDYELAWSVGYTTTVHGCTLSYENYTDMEGKTIESVTYYTTSGIYVLNLSEEVYLAPYYTGDYTATQTAGNAVTIEGLPDDAENVSVEVTYTVSKVSYTVEGSYDASTGVFTADDNFEIGTTYTVAITSDNYSFKTLSFTAEIITTALEGDIAEAQTLSESDYSAESWAALEEALAAAQAALEAMESQEAIDAAAAELESAIAGLIYISAVESEIESAQALTESDYTTDSWAALEEALADAQAALEAAESQEAIDAAAEALAKAVEGLVGITDNTDTTDQTVTEGDDLTYTVEGEYSADDLTITIGGNVVDPSYYTVVYDEESDTTTITIDSAYLSSLGTGSYDVLIESENGAILVDASVTVEETEETEDSNDDSSSTKSDDDTSDDTTVTDNTDTGDSGMTAYLFILMLCAGLAVVEIMRRRYASEK